MSETKSYQGFTEAERAAMKDRAKELKAAGKTKKTGQADAEAEVLAKLAEMNDTDRAIGERIHAIVKASVPSMTPRLWYGMPAYAQDGKLICFFQPAAKFKSRYATLGFSDQAKLDDGTMWPVYYAVAELTPATEARIAALVKRATS